MSGPEDYLWRGEPLSGECGHCRRRVDSTDPYHKVTSIVRGGRGVECVLRGDIPAAEGGLLRGRDTGTWTEAMSERVADAMEAIIDALDDAGFMRNDNDIDVSATRQVITVTLWDDARREAGVV